MLTCEEVCGETTLPVANCYHCELERLEEPPTVTSLPKSKGECYLCGWQFYAGDTLFLYCGEYICKDCHRKEEEQ